MRNLAHINGKGVLVVRATWDGEAGVWVAESDDVPGLVTEAPTSDELFAKLRTLVPELLELNNCMPSGDDVLVKLLADVAHEERISLRHT